MNYFGDFSSGEDERELARVVAANAKCDLVEIENRSAHHQFAEVLQVSNGATPTDLLGALRHCAGEKQLATRFNATAVFCGVGGDGLFYVGPLDYTVADHALSYRSPSKFLGLAMDVARRQGRSFWSVAWSALWTAVNAGRARVQPSYMRLVPPNVISEARRYDLKENSSIYAGIDCLLPGKRRQMPNLTYVPAMGSPMHAPDDPEYIAPLLSQPLVELCAQIPTYVLSERGMSRSAIRRAFNSRVPDKIIRRMAKGLIRSDTLELFRSQRSFLKEYMVDGKLTESGLLDRAKVSALLDSEQPDAREADELLSRHLSIEVWLRRWEDNPRSVIRYSVRSRVAT